MTALTWIKSTTDEWLNLELVNLSNVTTFGVYIIWHAGNPARVVRVGQGRIADRLAAHRVDREILAYKRFGNLYVTWAATGALGVGGIERYLANQLNPLAGDAFPQERPIAVNLPPW